MAKAELNKTEGDATDVAAASDATTATDASNAPASTSAPATVVLADAAPAPISTDPQASTPENTPVPGGGRWKWDIAKPGWVEV